MESAYSIRFIYPSRRYLRTRPLTYKPPRGVFTVMYLELYINAFVIRKKKRAVPNARWLQCEKRTSGIDRYSYPYQRSTFNVQPTVKFTATHTHVVSHGTDTQCLRKGELILSA